MGLHRALFGCPVLSGHIECEVASWSFASPIRISKYNFNYTPNHGIIPNASTHYVGELISLQEAEDDMHSTYYYVLRS